MTSIENRDQKYHFPRKTFPVFVLGTVFVRERKTLAESKPRLLAEIEATIPEISIDRSSEAYKASEFRDIVNVARKKLTIANIDRIVFNAQGAVGVLPSFSLFEQNVYIAIKKFYQTAITGKPNLHNFYTKEDLDSFEQEYTIVHNFGHSIIVCLA